MGVDRAHRGAQESALQVLHVAVGIEVVQVHDEVGVLVLEAHVERELRSAEYGEVLGHRGAPVDEDSFRLDRYRELRVAPDELGPGGIGVGPRGRLFGGRRLARGELLRRRSGRRVATAFREAARH